MKNGIGQGHYSPISAPAPPSSPPPPLLGHGQSLLLLLLQISMYYFMYRLACIIVHHLFIILYFIFVPISFRLCSFVHCYHSRKNKDTKKQANRANKQRL